MEKRQTPIQKAIQFWTERFKEAKEYGAVKTMEAADLFLEYLDASLAEERRFIEEVWDAGSESAYRNVRPDGPCEFDVKTHQADKTTLFSQFDK